MRALFWGLITLLCYGAVYPVSANDLLIRFASLQGARVPGILQAPNGVTINTRDIRRSLYAANFHPGDTVLWNTKTSTSKVYRNSTPTRVLARHFAHLDPAQNVAVVMPGQYWFSVGADSSVMDATGAVLFAGHFNRHRLVSSTNSDGATTSLLSQFSTTSATTTTAMCGADPPPAPPVITSVLSASGATGLAFNYQITASNDPTYFDASGLPAGLVVNQASGLISGTPTEDAPSSNVLLNAGNAGGTGTAILALNIIVPGRVYALDGSGPNSLRQHILDAAPGDTLSFDPSLDGATIVLDGTPLAIDRDLTIDASVLPNGVAISGNNLSRVFSIQANSSVTLKRLRVTAGNVAAGLSGGGGILVTAGSHLVLNEATVADNVSADIGGGLANYGTLEAFRSTFSGNHAVTSGGGIYTGGIDTGTSLTNSTVSTNSAASGGGFYHEGGAAILTHNSVAGNTASLAGGGIYNEAGSTTLAKTLIAHSIGDNCSGAAIINGNGNLADDASCGAGVGALTAGGLDPNLAGNGGPTLTHALLEVGGNNSAIDALACDAETLTDQRGVPRPQGAGLCDVGAVEFDPDSDHDGVVDRLDAFPDNPDESADADVDGMGDNFEAEFGFNPDNAADAAEDADSDGLNNREEFEDGTDPRIADARLRLIAGENFVALPVAPAPGLDSAGFLQHFSADPMSIGRYDRASGLWQTTEKNTGNITGPVFSMSATGGYLVRIGEPANGLFAGTAIAPTAVDLEPGLNLAGVGNGAMALDAMQLLQALGGPSAVSSISRFDPLTGRFQNVAYYDAEIVGSNFEILRGEAYLIHMRQSAVNLLVQ